MKEFYDKLSKEVLLKQVGLVEIVGDLAMYLGRDVSLGEEGYCLAGSQKCVQKLLSSMGLEGAKPVATPCVRCPPMAS